MIIFRLIWILIYSLIGWVVIIPLSFFIKKKRNLMIFIGRDDGKFTDNVKYMFLFTRSIADKEDIEYYFLTSNTKVFEELNDKHLPVLQYPSLKSFIKLIRANIIIADNDKWFFQFKYSFLHFSKKIQLWHGSGIKKLKVGMRAPNWKSFQKCLKTPSFIYDFLRDTWGLLIKYDIFASSSEYWEKNYFRKSFKSKLFLNAGYPRNDILCNKPNDLMFLGSDQESIENVKRMKDLGYKIILYSPTFRNGQNDPLNKEIININRLVNFAENNKIAFIFKFHPNVKIKYDEYGSENSRFIFYNSFKDIYPCLPFTDMMITDYSSLYFDYLFLNRPIIFFCYDLDNYINKDQDLQFDYNWVTPGPKCFNQDELESAIHQILSSEEDQYAPKRQQIFDICFDHKEGQASQRIWDCIKSKYITR